ncbi:hypothetical protein V8F20_004150 [Naviculisporaceae sp. PSN 640]
MTGPYDHKIAYEYNPNDENVRISPLTSVLAAPARIGGKGLAADLKPQAPRLNVGDWPADTGVRSVMRSPTIFVREQPEYPHKAYIESRKTFGAKAHGQPLVSTPAPLPPTGSSHPPSALSPFQVPVDRSFASPPGGEAPTLYQAGQHRFPQVARTSPASLQGLSHGPTADQVEELAHILARGTRRPRTPAILVHDTPATSTLMDSQHIDITPSRYGLDVIQKIAELKEAMDRAVKPNPSEDDGCGFCSWLDAEKELVFFLRNLDPPISYAKIKKDYITRLSEPWIRFRIRMAERNFKCLGPRDDRWVQAYGQRNGGPSRHTEHEDAPIPRAPAQENVRLEGLGTPEAPFIVPDEDELPRHGPLQ